MKYPILRSYDAVNAKKHGKNYSWTDRVIMMRSAPLVHTEFQFSDEYDNISFSFTKQDDDDGGRFKDITYSHPIRWVNIILPMTPEQEEKAYKKAWELEGLPYDLIGLLSFTSKANIIKPSKKANWCNEGCGHLLIAAYDWQDFIPHNYSPTTMYWEVIHRLQAMEQIA